MNKRHHFFDYLVVSVCVFLLFFSVTIPWLAISRNQETKQLNDYKNTILLLEKKSDIFELEKAMEAISNNGDVRFLLVEKSDENIVAFDTAGIETGHNLYMEDRLLKVHFSKDDLLGPCYSVYFDIDNSYICGASVKMTQSHIIAKRMLEYGPIVCVFLIIVVCVFLSFNYRKSLRPLKLQISKLQNLTNISRTIDYEDDLNYLTMVLRDSRHKLRNELEINRISDQKMNFILDSFSEGLIVIDSSYKVVLVNKKALQIFSYEKDEIQDRHLENLNAPHELEVNFSMVIHTNKSLSFVQKINSRVYQCDINPIDYSWTRGITNEKNGASLVLIDITDDYNSGSMKKEFFANASHELKSPLTSVLGYLQLIEAHAIQDPEDVEKAIAKCIFESKRMNKIISDMLTLSSLESESLKQIEEIPVCQITDSILSSLEPQIIKKNIHVVKDYHPFVIKMNFEDFDKLIRNLLDNGIKYNKEGGSLFITIQDYRISVRDTGIGISLENQSRVFERFFRVDKARSKKSGDTGLGLAIVKHICNYYDAQVSLKSTLDVGSEFTIEFSKNQEYNA